jgi:hypothetical protein
LIETGMAKRQLNGRTVLHRITFTVKCFSRELMIKSELCQKNIKMQSKFKYCYD